MDTEWLWTATGAEINFLTWWTNEQNYIKINQKKLFVSEKHKWWWECFVTQWPGINLNMQT